MRTRQENWKDASIGNQNLCDVWLLSGRLSRLQKDEGGRVETSSDDALATADEALRLAELADDAHMRQNSHAYRGHVRALWGDVPAALVDFRVALKWQQKKVSNDWGLQWKEEPLFGNRGYWHTYLLARLGRDKEATQLTVANQEIAIERDFGHDIPKCQLIVSSLLIERSGSLSSADLWTQARGWALARDAKEVLCWSYLVEAQHALVHLSDHFAQRRRVAEETDHESETLRLCVSARDSIGNGLRIARDCGYGLYHIDLLLERARLHLLRGDAGAALDDIGVALDSGIPADEKTGQPELLAANAEECGYAWAIPAGLQLRAEALLLQAAQELESSRLGCLECGTSVVDEPDRSTCHTCRAGEGKSHQVSIWIATDDNVFLERESCSGIRHGLSQRFPEVDGWLAKWNRFQDWIAAEFAFSREDFLRIPIDAAASVLISGQMSDEVETIRGIYARMLNRAGRINEILPLIDQAKRLLHQALDLWQPLHDPEPERDDQNFKLNGKEYNYKAAETHRILTDLEDGVLTRYPLEPIAADDDSDQTRADARLEETEVKNMLTFDTFLSHNSKDKPDVKRLGEALKKRGMTVWLDEWELRPGLSWQDALEDIIANCKSAAVCVGNDGIGPWEDPEMKALLRRFVNEKKTGNIVPIIPALLPGAPDNIKLPLFLEEFTWVDLRDGLKKEGLDRLQWGITGVKPNP